MLSGTQTTYSATPDTFASYLKKIWTYRSLIFTLAKRDLKIKYAQTALGLLWAILQPLTGLLIFTFFFNEVVKIEVPGGNYAIFAFTGMTSWYFFSYIVYQSSTSLIQARDLISKIFFPKLILHLSKVLVGAVDFGLSILLLVVLMLVFGIAPSANIILLPFFILLNVMVGLAVSLWLSALTIKYRDLHHIIPYLVNFGIWLTPVFFPGTLIPVKFSFILYLNPMAGVVEGYRWCILGLDTFSPYYFIGLGIALLLLLSGFVYFRKVEDDMIDYI
ncbi:ABC transporter permease [soil metagenome]